MMLLSSTSKPAPGVCLYRGVIRECLLLRREVIVSMLQEEDAMRMSGSVQRILDSHGRTAGERIYFAIQKEVWIKYKRTQAPDPPLHLYAFRWRSMRGLRMWWPVCVFFALPKPSSQTILTSPMRCSTSSTTAVVRDHSKYLTWLLT